MAIHPGPLLRPIPEAVPTELRAIARWVCWKARPKPNGRLDKLPCSPHTGSVGDAHDPASWGSFEQAVAAMRRHRLDGVGIVLTGEDSLVGVDLDGCIDDAGVVAPWAGEIVAELDSYTERSPSGHGLRLFASGGLPAGRRKVGDLEIYDDARFLTVTGHHMEGTPATVERRERELRDLHAWRLGGVPTDGSPVDGPVPATVDEEEPPVRLDAWGLALWRGERLLRTAAGTVDRSRTLYALACVLARAGATVSTISAALAERDRALGLDKYAGRRDGGLAYRRMAARAAQESRTAAGAPISLARLTVEQRRLRQEVERLQSQQRAVLLALRAMGAPMGSAREGEQP